MKVLFCSPYSSVGGIARWTMHIMNYYRENIPSNLELKLYYPSSKQGGHAGDSFLYRLYRGIINYIPLWRGVKKQLQTGDFELIHLCSSASISLLKDILIVRTAKRLHVKSVVHFRFGRIPQIFESKNWEYKLLVKVIKLADCIIVIDQRSYNTLIDAGIQI